MTGDSTGEVRADVPEDQAGDARAHEGAARRVNPIPPSARAFQGLRAGVVSRAIAGAVDYALMAAATIGCWVAAAVLLFLIDPRDYVAPTWPFGVFLAVGFFLFVTALTISFATTGRTAGGRLRGLRVVGRKGRRSPWWSALVRAAVCVVFPVGLFWCAVSRQNRSVQDVVLRTSVIHQWPVEHAVPALIDVEKRSEL